MPALSDVKQNETKFMGLFMGPTKSGKKTAIASFPKPIYIFDLDGRVDGIAGSKHVSTKDIFFDYYPPDESKTTVEKITNQLKMFIQQAAKGQLEYKTIAFCSFTGLTRNFIFDGVRITHEMDKNNKVLRGNYAEKLALAGPEDYKYEATATSQVMAFLRALPCHVIISAHVVPIWKKPKKPNGDVDQFAESIKDGERVHLRDKIASDILIYFNHTFSFKKVMLGQDKIRYKVRFRGENEGTTFPELPEGEVDITDTMLFPQIMEQIEKVNKANLAKGVK